ncbi:MAG: hypothetical protein CMH25_00855 [Micavibrio sp.]|nr:hypothetical protein [Micavibrio sp.]|tara:strand:- start:172831 stop:173718 length:888 start_codon:yes stop_codon:yes gene_type:complete
MLIKLYHKISTQRTTVPLQDKRSDRITLVLIALMVCLLLLISSTTQFFGTLSHSWESNLKSGLTLEIPNGVYDSTLQNKLNTLFETNSLIKNYSVKERDDIIQSLSPWLDLNDMSTEELPTPVIVHLELGEARKDEKSAFMEQLKVLNDTIIVRDHEIWFEQSISIASKLKTISFLVSLLLFVVLAGIMTIIVRDRVLIHENVIKLLHSLGATDNYILRDFYKHILVLCIKAVFIGLLLFALASLIFIFLFEGGLLRSSLYSMQATHIFMIAIAVILLAFIMIRITVLSVLKKSI